MNILKKDSIQQSERQSVTVLFPTLIPVLLRRRTFLFLPQIRELCNIIGPFQGTNERPCGTKIITEMDTDQHNRQKGAEGPYQRDVVRA